MSFEKNASALLKEAVASIAPELAVAVCPAEVASERQKNRVELYVARRLFGMEFRDVRALEKFLGNKFDPEGDALKCRLTQEMLPFNGIGDDSFFLNEHFSCAGPTLSGFDTMRNWDEYTHNTQEQYAADEGNRADGIKPYEGRLLWDWGRWLHDGRLVYGVLSVALSHLSAQVADYADDLARDRFKTTYIEGPENGKKVVGGFRWDMIETPVANGAMRYASSHIAHLVVRLLEEKQYKRILADSGVWVSVIRSEEDGEINEDVVFSGVEAMDRARFRHWLEDIAVLPDGKEIYDAIVSQEKARIQRLMEIVFEEVEVAGAALGELTKGQWHEVVSIAVPALRTRHEDLEGLEFTPRKEAVGKACL